MTNSATNNNHKLPDLENMPLEDIDQLIEAARTYRMKRQTNPVLAKGYSDSVAKHTKHLLIAVQKLLKSEGVNPLRWQEVEENLKKLQLDTYKDEAMKVK